MGIFGTMAVLSLVGYILFLLFIKIIGSTQHGDKHNSINEAIQKDTDEFNQF